MAREREIIWDRGAKSTYQKYLSYILKKSYQNALSVNEDIQGMIDKLSEHPEAHPPDKYKKHNDGSYRAFEKHKARITYRVLNDVIKIIRVRSVWKQPRKF